MTKLIPIAAAAAALALFGAAPAMAQYLSTPMDAMMNQALAGNDALTMQIQGGLGQIQQGAMNDPQVQMAYQNYVSQGGYPQDFATWALNYRATNGYDTRAVQDVYRQQAINTASEQQAWNGYQDARGSAAAAYAAMQSGYADNQNQLGMATNGQQFYPDPSGAQVGLSYMPNAGSSTNGQSGYTYVPNGNGGYTAYDMNGYAYQMPYNQW